MEQQPEVSRPSQANAFNFADLDDEDLLTAMNELLQVVRERKLAGSPAIGSYAINHARQTVNAGEAVKTIVTDDSVVEPDQTANLEKPNSLLQEFLETLNDSHAAYNNVCDDLGEPPLSLEEFTASFNHWFTPDRAASVEKELAQAPGLSYVVVPSPNKTISLPKIYQLTERFGQRVGLHARLNTIYGTHFRQHYTPEQFSGPKNRLHDGENWPAVKFVLIPNHPLRGAPTHADYQLKTNLYNKQLDNPHIRIPSVLEAVCYWYVLDEKGILEHTAAKIRHIDLPMHRNPHKVYGFAIPATSPLPRSQYDRDFGISCVDPIETLPRYSIG